MLIGVRWKLRFGNGDARVRAAEALGRRGDRRALAALIRALGDPVPSVRDASLAALAQVDPDWRGSRQAQRAVEWCRVVLRMSYPEQWPRAVGILASICHPESAAALVSYALHGDGPKRHEALAGIRSCPAARDALLQRLGNPSREMRLAAARALAEIACARPLEPIIHALAESYQPPPDAATDEPSSGSHATALLVQLLDARDGEVRQGAGRVLRLLGREPPEAALRATLAAVLGEWSRVAAEGALAARPLALELDQTERRDSILRALVRIGPPAVEVLGAVLPLTAIPARLEVIRALGEIGDPRAITPLLGQTGDLLVAKEAVQQIRLLVEAGGVPNGELQRVLQLPDYVENEYLGGEDQSYYTGISCVELKRAAAAQLGAADPHP